MIEQKKQQKKTERKIDLKAGVEMIDGDRERDKGCEGVLGERGWGRGQTWRLGKHNRERQSNLQAGAQLVRHL